MSSDNFEALEFSIGRSGCTTVLSVILALRIQFPRLTKYVYWLNLLLLPLLLLLLKKKKHLSSCSLTLAVKLRCLQAVSAEAEAAAACKDVVCPPLRTCAQTLSRGRAGVCCCFFHSFSIFIIITFQTNWRRFCLSVFPLRSYRKGRPDVLGPRKLYHPRKESRQLLVKSCHISDCLSWIARACSLSILGYSPDSWSNELFLCCSVALNEGVRLQNI